MKIAIHHKENDFSSKWIAYCEDNHVNYKIVNCYDNDIIDQLSDCDGLMWHFHHSNPKDVLFAKQLLFALETVGYKVFPNSNTCWHFDDKIAQKYLLEAIGAPLVPSYVFYEKQEALNWIYNTHFPKVFKLRRGSASKHVKLVRNRNSAKQLIKKAFDNGFSQYDAFSNLKERWRKFKVGKTNLQDVLKGVIRLHYKTEFSKVIGKERGYVYFQDFIPDNSYDIRINVVSNKCFACLRLNRSGDFRASGSGKVSYDFNKIPIEAIKIAFSISQKLKLQSVAFDFILDNNEPLLLEMSYGFGVDPDDFKFGYWNSELEFIENEFNPYGWMVESLLKQINKVDDKNLLV